MGPEGRRYVERDLPAAVFISFAVYIAYSEAVRESSAAPASLAVIADIAFPNAFGLISAAARGPRAIFI